MKRSQNGIVLFALSSALMFTATQAQADLIPVMNGQQFGTLLNPTLDPNFDVNAPNPPVVNSTDNPVVAVYDSVANVTWMSDQHLFQEQYNANNFFLSTLIGNEVTNPDGSHHKITANDFWYDSGVNRQLASMSGVVAWINNINANHYLGVTNWSLPKLADAQSLWNQLFEIKTLPNQTQNGIPCNVLIGYGILGCGYYDSNVGPFTYIVPTSWTSDTTGGPGQASWYNFGTSNPGAQLTSALNAGYEPTSITPGYTGVNQQNGPGSNIESFSNPQAVVRCNVFNVPVPGKPRDYGRCDNDMNGHN